MDFVVTWVDDKDPEWKEQFYKYRNEERPGSHNSRFRSWDNFHYWFRGVEKFAPWVNKVHLVTWGHVPKWLNTNNPKLNIVKHTDFIPKEYLPTFNTRTIELNFHRIKGLSEEYVVFNDDVFLIDHVKPEMFFVDGKPCDIGLLKPMNMSEYSKAMFNDLIVINKHFDIKKQINKKPTNWFNIKYRFFVFINFLFYLTLRSHHIAFKNYHITQASKKSTLKTIWEKEYEIMNKSCISIFRDPDTVNNDVQRYWDLVSNNFYPYNIKKNGTSLNPTEEVIENICRYIKKQKKPIICINDSEIIDNFEYVKVEVNQALGSILNNKSSYEI